MLQVQCASDFFPASHGIFDSQTGCTDEGRICNNTDCSEVLYCFGAGSSPIHAETCSTGTFCNSDDGECTSKFCSTNPGNSFICGQAGVFPDPSNCSKAVLCTGFGVPSHLCSCPDPYEFDLAAGCKESKGKKNSSFLS